MNRLYKGFELPVVVKSAKLAEDGMSATVELYSALKNNEEYAINVPGYDVQKLTASVGNPVEVLLFKDAANKYADAELVEIDGTTNLVTVDYRLIDANGVDVTNVVKNNGTLFLNAETSLEGNYFVSDKVIWFTDENIDVTVTAEFQMYDNAGNLLTPAKGEKTFVSMKKPPVEVIGLADWKIGGDWNAPKKSLPLDETATLELKIKLSEGDPAEVKEGKNAVLNGSIRLEELNPDVAALNGFDIVYFKQGTAKILVYYCYKDGEANDVELPIAQINAEAKVAKKLQTIGLDKASLNIGTVANFDDGTVTLFAKDNYGNDFTDYSVEVTGVDDKTTAIAGSEGVVAVDGNKVTFYGAKIKEANEKDDAQLTFKIKVKSTKGEDVTLEKNVVVIYKSPKKEGTEYTRVEAAGFGVDVARTAKDDNTKAAKTGTFTVYQYSNGVKVDTLDVVAYDADALTAGTLYFKVTKDGKDISKSDMIKSENGVVTLNFSGTKTEGERTLVTYGLGAGNYVFTLYEVVTVGEKAFPRPVSGATAAGAVTCNLGSYTYVGRGDQEALGANSYLKMFKFKNAQGQDVAADVDYTVDVDDTAANYVYVKSFTFYDDVTTDKETTTVKVAYTVPVGVALKK